MKKKIIILFWILLCTTIFFNMDFLPVRNEIANMQIVVIAGFDKLEDGYEISFLKRDKSSGEQNDSNKAQIISIKGADYNTAMRNIQAITDKYIPSSYIRYYILGEETAKEDFAHALDNILRGNKIRLNAKVYIAEGCTAKEFLTKTIESEYKIEEKLYNMENNIMTRRTQIESDLINLRHITMSKEKEGVVSCLKFEKENEKTKSEEVLTSNDKDNTNVKIPFDFSGVGIIKDMKLVDYLDKEETATLNYIKNTNSIGNVKVEEGKDFLSFGLEEINTSVKFEFNQENIISKVIFNIVFMANYEEIKAEKPVFTLKAIENYNKKINERIKERVKKLVDKEIYLNTDFIGLKQKLEFYHPFKFKYNKEDFITKLKNCEIIVNSNGHIQTTYDVSETNIYQEGQGK